MVNVNQLKGRIVMNGYNQREISSLLRISESLLSSKINNRAPFDTKEIDLLCELLNITEDQDKIDIFLCESSQNRDK